MKFEFLRKGCGPAGAEQEQLQGSCDFTTLGFVFSFLKNKRF